MTLLNGVHSPSTHTSLPPVDTTPLPPDTAAANQIFQVVQKTPRLLENGSLEHLNVIQMNARNGSEVSTQTDSKKSISNRKELVSCSCSGLGFFVTLGFFTTGIILENSSRKTDETCGTILLIGSAFTFAIWLSKIRVYRG